VGFNTESRAIFKAVHPDRENPDIDAVKLGEEDEGPDGDVLATEGEKRVYMGAEQEDVISKIGETFKTIDLFERNEGKARGATKNKGKRSLQQSGNRDGRYVGSRITEDKNPDLAFDATVRAAAPYQRKRHAEQASDMAVIIEKTDMREKIREARTSSTFLFAVDTSGSLIIRNRMTAVKGAILSLLQEHYVKKDRVGFVTFNEKSIDMLLQPSREVEVIYKMLDELAIGKRTPLSAALQYLSDYMSMYTKKRPNDECFVVLVTDGGANVPLDPEDKETDPLEEALGIARRMNLPSVKWIVIDSEKRTDKAHYAKDFADALRARYYTLDELRIETREQQNLIRVAKQRIMK
ncbi:MAG: VWA domain-containing protein, partial [Candidatus Methanomethylophilaceae archaeon]|nr:VWA domain-containing protein [Candidatus Methanomethylophilaceae archaeon]